MKTIDKASLALSRCDELERLIKKKRAAKIEESPSENIESTHNRPNMRKIEIEGGRFPGKFSYYTNVYSENAGSNFMMLDIYLYTTNIDPSTNKAVTTDVENTFCVSVYVNGVLISQTTKITNRGYAQICLPICANFYANINNIEIDVVCGYTRYFDVEYCTLSSAENVGLYTSFITPPTRPAAGLKMCACNYRDGIDINGNYAKEYIYALIDKNNKLYAYKSDADNFTFDTQPIITVPDVNITTNSFTVSYRAKYVEGLGGCYGKLIVNNCLKDSTNGRYTVVGTTNYNIYTRINQYYRIDLTPHLDVNDSTVAAFTTYSKYVTFGKMHCTETDYSYLKVMNRCSDTDYVHGVCPLARNTGDFYKDIPSFMLKFGVMYSSEHESTDINEIINFPKGSERVLSASFAGDNMDVYLYAIRDNFLERHYLAYDENTQLYTCVYSQKIAYGILEFKQLYGSDIMFADGEHVYFSKEGDKFLL